MLTDLRLACRTLCKAPTFAATAVLVLTIGIGANTAVFSALDTLLFRPLPYRDADRLVMMGDLDRRTGFRTGTSLLRWRQWAARVRSFEAVAAVEPGLTVRWGTGSEYVSAARVTTNFFDVIGVAQDIGRTFVSSDGIAGAIDCVVLSQELWRRQFGVSLEVAGRSVLLGGRTYAVIGVLPAGFRLPLTRHDVWLPVRDASAADVSADRSFRLVGRLRSGVTADSALDELRVVAEAFERERPADRQVWGLWLQTIRQVTVGPRGPLAAVLAATVGLVLLIACFNIATLQLARVTTRRRELAVRVALGARRRDLVRLALAEGLLVSLAGASGAVILVFAVRQLGLARVPELADMAINARVLVFAILLGGASAVLFSAAPALLAARAGVGPLLNTGSLGGASHASRLQRTFVTVQTACALALLTAAGVLLSALVHLTSIDPGFRCNEVLAVETSLPPGLVDSPEARRRITSQLAASLASVPGIGGVAIGSSLPFFGVQAARLEVEGGGAGDEHLAGVRSVTPSYFDVFGIPLRAGRRFGEADDERHPAVAIVNEGLARLAWPSGGAVGSRVRLGAEWITIVGVAGDVRSVGLRQPVLPELYRPLRQAPPGAMSLAVETKGEPLAYVSAVRAAVNRVHPEAAVQYINSMAALLDEQVTLVRWLTLFGSVSACLALALAALGLYGVIACLVARRTPEIGLRVALGANAQAVVGLVLGSGARTVAAGLALGTALAVGVIQLLRAILLEAGSPPLLTFAAVAVVILAVDLCAMWIPARRAARVDPAIALRQE